MERRKFVPDVKAIADQLIADYRRATFSFEGFGGPGEHVPEGDIDAISTMTSWTNLARERDGEWREDDWLALVQVLACRAAWPRGPGIPFD
jgi:hypothetical protein